VRHLLPIFTLSILAPILACDQAEDDALLDAEQSELLEPLDPEIEAQIGTIAFDPSERDELELLAPEEHEQTVSCGLGLPPVVLAGPSKQATANGQIHGIAQGLYFFDAVRPTFPWLFNWLIKVGTTTVAQLNTSSSLFFAMDGSTFKVEMQAPAGALPGATYDLEVRLYTSSSQLACTDEVTLEIADCGSVGWWYTNPWPTPGYDGANCHVTWLPPGAQSFVWSNNWYVTPTNGNQCSIGTFDGANCYIGSAPGGHTAFIYDNSVYFSY
jgi:hypothetical protein